MAEEKRSAHRPSRRSEIIDAAIRVFAAKSFADTSVADIAAESDVVPSAVYYHFTGKDELFTLALRRVLDMLDALVDEVRVSDVPSQPGSLEAVTLAVWKWVGTHPDEARLVYFHLPGATPEASALRKEFEESHVQRAFDYLEPAAFRGTRRQAAQTHSTHTLAMRTLIQLLMTVHSLRMDDGPLGKHSSKALSSAVVAVSNRIITVD